MLSTLCFLNESGGCFFAFKGKSNVFFVIYKRQKESVNVNAAESILLWEAAAIIDKSLTINVLTPITKSYIMKANIFGKGLS